MGDLSKAGMGFLVVVNDDNVAGIEMAGFAASLVFILWLRANWD